MVATDALTERPLTQDDMPEMMGLVAEAGWNQTEADWLMMMRIGSAQGIADPDNRIIGTAVTISYGKSIGWVGMVLVTSHWRGQGIATRLMKACIDDLCGADLVPGLDATPAGEQVYAKLGFSGTVRLTRMRRPARPAEPVTTLARPIKTGDSAQIAALDADVFGAPRNDLMRAMCARTSEPGWLLGSDGFLVHRAGRKARQIGPICAPSDNIASELLTTALAEFSEELVIDVPDAKSDFIEHLIAKGFVAERPFLRMYLGEPAVPGNPARLYAIAGPELG